MKTLSPAEQQVYDLARTHATEQGRTIAFKRIVACSSQFYLIEGFENSLCSNPQCKIHHPILIAWLYMDTSHGFLCLQEKSIKSMETT